MTRKQILVGSAVLIILLGAAGAVLYTQLGRIIRGGVETHGPAVTGTPVRLAQASVSPWSGQGVLQGFQIANPPGYESPYAFSLDDIAIELEPGSVTQEVVRIRSIVISGPSLIAEFTEDGESNLKTIMQHVRQLSKGGESRSADEPTDGVERKFIIERFVLKAAQVRVFAPALKLDEHLEIAEIELRDIGASEGGAAIEDVARQLLKPVIDAAVDAARAKYIGTRRAEIRQLIRDEAKELMDKLLKRD